MATIGTAVTLQDFKTRLDENDKVTSTIIELLTDTNDILSDMRWMEGNLLTGHKTTIRTGIPSATWRRLNYGVAAVKSTTSQQTDTCGMLETYGKVDKALADLNGQSAAWRMSEEAGVIQGMNNQMATTLFYGDTDTNPERFLGLAPRYETPSSNEDISGFNIINGGGSGSDNTSIWLVGWGSNTVHGIYPKGSKAGLTVRDLGEDTASDGAGGEYQILRTHYKWDCGLTVRDWRYVVRIANVDISNLVADSSAANLVKLMAEATDRLPSMGGITPVFYCHRTVKTALRDQIRNKTNVQLSLDTVAGKHMLMLDGIPIHRSDAILKTEAAITGTFGS